MLDLINYDKLKRQHLDNPQVDADRYCLIAVISYLHRTSEKSNEMSFNTLIH